MQEKLKVIIVSHHHIKGYEGKRYSLNDLRWLLPIGSVWNVEKGWKLDSFFIFQDTHPEIFVKINEKAPGITGFALPEGWAEQYTPLHIIKHRLKQNESNHS